MAGSRLPPPPEPFDYYYEWDGPYGARKFSSASRNGLPPSRAVAIYTSTHLFSYASQARKQALEEAAKLCDDFGDSLDRHKWPTPHAMAKAIRELMED